MEKEKCDSPTNSFYRKVEKKAYEFYEKRGFKQGHDWDDWFEAEKAVEAKMSAVDKDCIRSESLFEASHRPYSLPSYMACSLLLAVSAFGFTNYVQRPDSGVLMQERVNEKITFDYNQALYNDQANTEIRSKNAVEQKAEKKDKDKKKVEELQDKTKGQILIKF